MRQNRPLVFSIELDFLQVVLFLFALGTRLWLLHYPNAIVFDELHYARYVSMYLKRTFFFDSHPPLGKLMLAAAAMVAGWDVAEEEGEEEENGFTFDRIGTRKIAFFMFPFCLYFSSTNMIIN